MSSPDVDSTAILGSGVQLGPDVVVGPYCVIRGVVTIGSGTRVGPYCLIQGPTSIGEENELFGHAALGTDPQDLKYRGEVTTLKIGDRNRIREFVTINRGTEGGGGTTVIGSGNLLMTGVHVAHDCIVGDGAILANSATLAGHVLVQDCATVGAFSGVHQFCRVGRYAFVGGYSVLTRDALPFVKTVGVRSEAAIFGINTLGLQRRGFTQQKISSLRRAYRELFLKRGRLSEALERIQSDAPSREVQDLIRFIRSSQRGVIRGTARRPRREPAGEAARD